MGVSDTQFQLIDRGRSSDNVAANDALANRQGCDFNAAVSGMSPGQQLDVLRNYERESKKDSENFPKIDVNFDKNGYEIKAPDANNGDKSEPIASTKFNDNDGVKSQSCQNLDMPEGAQTKGHGGGSTSSSENMMNSMSQSTATSDSLPAGGDGAVSAPVDDKRYEQNPDVTPPMNGSGGGIPVN
jgi:hypothetical protein